MKEKIDALFERGIIADVLPDKNEFIKELSSGKKLRFYIGMDPTAKALHLGHAQNLMILEDFRKMGHEVIFLIGDFTGMIGDPTDKSSARVRQNNESVQENFKDWKNQVKTILDFDDKENPVQIKYNSEWLGKLNFEQIVDLASNFTVQQMLERDMFEKRMQEERPIHLHEFLYPLMQGYDSVVMDVDVELCGSDQIFNALAGRTLLKRLKNKDKFVVVANLIADEKTGMMMSKSNGTGVFLNLSANDLFGAIMSQPDGMIKPLLIGCTRIPMERVKELENMDNPRDAKIELAKEIVRIYRGEEDAKKSEEYFISTFSKKELPSEIAEFLVEGEMKLAEVLVKSGNATSLGDARRKIEQGGVSISDEKLLDPQILITKEFNGKVLKIGKMGFLKIVFGR